MLNHYIKKLITPQDIERLLKTNKKYAYCEVSINMGNDFFKIVNFSNKVDDKAGLFYPIASLKQKIGVENAI